MKKKSNPGAALKNFYDICPIIPVGDRYLIRQPSQVLTPQLLHFLLLPKV